MCWLCWQQSDEVGSILPNLLLVLDEFKHVKNCRSRCSTDTAQRAARVK